jgi:periplasmic divalent cation tolerance protein
MSQSSHQPVVVLTTLPTTHDAEAFLTALLAERLIACGTVGGAVRSVYRWQGAVEIADEQPIALKTTRDCLSELEAAVRARHPYEVPEWLVLTVEAASAAYGEWIVSETRPA